MIRRLLIANRGEIAIRVARAARELGIRTTGIYSEADRGSLHVRAMDDAVAIGPAPPAESYLDIERILKVARQVEVEAIHPGYGFLAENPGFVARCEEEGIAFVGPPPRAMALTGDKIASRKAMAAQGIPVTRGVDRIVRSSDEAEDIAGRLGYPVLFKATAGGGGIGMSRVNRRSELAAAFESARSIALANFGNPDLFLEKYVERARHIEIQIMIDRRGRGVHLGERECSVQRRHQKLVEESPAPGVGPRQRARIGGLAVKALRAIGYRNAGTVEFLYSGGRFSFNEVNARLQVEHPVTEMVTGVDLVRQQLLVASGEDVDVSQSEIAFRGHALECRINAEDPLRNFLPSPGRITNYREPAGPGVRVDSGIALESSVPPMYDPLVAKVIVAARNREESVRRMERALGEFEIRGISTTIPFHQALLAERHFVAGDLWTTMVQDLRIPTRIGKRGPRGPPENEVAALAAALVAGRGLGAIAGIAGVPLMRPETSSWARAGRQEQLGGDHEVPSRRRW